MLPEFCSKGVSTLPGGATGNVRRQNIMQRGNDDSSGLIERPFGCHHASDEY